MALRPTLAGALLLGDLREREGAAAAVARQVRIMFAAGKDAPEVCSSLQQIELSIDEAEAVLAARGETDGQAL